MSRTELPPVGHHVPAAALAGLATAALVLAPGFFGPTGLLIMVVVAQGGLIAAWSRATSTRGYVGSLVIGAGTAVVADTILALQEQPDLAPLAAVLALAFIAAMLHQLLRSNPRRLATASLAGISTLAVALIAMSALLLLYRITDGSTVYVAIVGATGGAVVVGHVVDLLLPLPRITPEVPRGLTALVISVGVAIAAAVTLSDPSGLIDSLGAAMVGAILGLVSALLAVAASYIAAERRELNWSLPWLQALIPLAGAAPIGYFLALQVLG
ncbi:MAG: hypothetical protein H0T54_10275 [Geodermatophilaceae bacterium]|nr:hypothetical protein [Geodermatophilaceae bacterium]